MLENYTALLNKRSGTICSPPPQVAQIRPSPGPISADWSMPGESGPEFDVGPSLAKFRPVLVELRALLIDSWPSLVGRSRAPKMVECPRSSALHRSDSLPQLGRWFRANAADFVLTLGTLGPTSTDFDPPSALIRPSLIRSRPTLGDVDPDFKMRLSSARAGPS